MILVLVLIILYIQHDTGFGSHNIIHRAWYWFWSSHYYTSSMILVLVLTILYIKNDTGSGPNNNIHRAWYWFRSSQYYTSIMILVVVLTILYIEHNTGSGPHDIIHRAWYCFCSTQYYTSSMILVLVPTILYIEETVTWIHKILIFSQIWRRTTKFFKWIYVLHNGRKVSWAKITNVINVFTLNVVICLTNCGE